MTVPCIKVLHPITRLIIGGAQENTMLTADRLTHDPAYGGRYTADIVCGPQTGPEGSLIEEVRRRHISLTILDSLVRQIDLVQDLKTIVALRDLMVRGNYKIVHTHSSKAGVLGRIAARLGRIPHIVHTVHGWSFNDQMSPPKHGLYVMLEKMAARCGHVMIAVHPRDIDKGLARGIGRRQGYTVIRSGIELDRFGHPQIESDEIRKQLGIPPDVPIVGSVIRMSPQKAPLDLVDAFAHVYREQPQTWFVIVGDGPLRMQVKTQLRTLGIAQQTVLTGLRRDVPELIAIFDVFALSSLWEGLPRVLIQAMATGLPIVCTQADGTVEAVEDGVNGFLVSRGNSIAMGAHIIKLLLNPVIRKQMGEAGRRRVSEFGVDKMVADIDRLYIDLLDS